MKLTKEQIQAERDWCRRQLDSAITEPHITFERYAAVLDFALAQPAAQEWRPCYDCMNQSIEDGKPSECRKHEGE